MYMAPEMVRHELYTGKADVYSWGVLLAETLAQRPPYEGLYLTPVQASASDGLAAWMALTLRALDPNQNHNSEHALESDP